LKVQLHDKHMPENKNVIADNILKCINDDLINPDIKSDSTTSKFFQSNKNFYQHINTCNCNCFCTDICFCDQLCTEIPLADFALLDAALNSEIEKIKK